QLTDIVPNRPLDFSRTNLPAPTGLLSEANLSESTGIGGPIGQWIAYGPVLTTRPPVIPPSQAVNLGTTANQRWVVIAPANGSIDWNKNGVIASSNVSVDIDNLSVLIPRCDGHGTDLHGYDDWSRLRYDFRSSPNFADGIHTIVPIHELTLEDAIALSPDG